MKSCIGGRCLKSSWQECSIPKRVVKAVDLKNDEESHHSWVDRKLGHCSACSPSEETCSKSLVLSIQWTSYLCMHRGLTEKLVQCGLTVDRNC